jgi:hypothetical protein
MARLEERHKLVGVPKTVGGRLEFRRALWRIAAQRHDVSESVAMDPIGYLLKLAPRVPDAGEVGHDRVAELRLQEPAHLCGALPRASAGAVGHRYEIGRDRLERCGRLAERLNPRVVLWRKKLYRAQRASLCEEFGEGSVGFNNISTHQEILICVKNIPITSEILIWSALIVRL